jgi:6-pyruvoyltetrahydropterin/6-carboxytetrahydropterin synthase
MAPATAAGTFEIEVETTFSAAHALRFRGSREPVHGHDFRVTVRIGGGPLDADGLLFDFHEVERHLGEIVTPFRNRDLNATPPFDLVNPSAEEIARFIATALSARLPASAAVRSVRVTEAPGCAAIFRPAAGGHR